MIETDRPAQCPHCDRPMPQRAERDGLLAMSEPWRVFWEGRAMTGLAPMPIRFLFMLLRSPTGEVALGSFDIFLRDNAAPISTKVHISRVRSWLRAGQLPFDIQSIHGWGYRLVRLAPIGRPQ